MMLMQTKAFPFLPIAIFGFISQNGIAANHVPIVSSHKQPASSFVATLSVGQTWEKTGRSRLERISGQTLNDGLSLNHLYTNGMSFHLTWTA